MTQSQKKKQGHGMLIVLKARATESLLLFTGNLRPEQAAVVTQHSTVHPGMDLAHTCCFSRRHKFRKTQICSKGQPTKADLYVLSCHK